MELPERPRCLPLTSVDDDQNRMKTLTLLGLPTEVRLRILRHLLVHNGPLENESPVRLSADNPYSEDATDDDSDEWSDEEDDESEEWSDRDSESDGSSSDEAESTRSEESLVDNSIPHVNLHRVILLVNRQLYKEGSTILYQENSVSLRLRAHRKGGPFDGELFLSFFDHRNHHEIDLLKQSELHSSLFKFCNLHFDVGLELHAYSCRVRSVLRCIVSWLNEKYESPLPRRITVAYEDTIRTRDPFYLCSDLFLCKDCGVHDFKKCQCERSINARSRAETESLVVMAPLRHLLNVKQVDIIGLSDTKAQTLSSAMLTPEKPIDLCPSYASLLRYLEKLPDDDDTKEVRTELNFKTLRYRAKKSNDPLRAELGRRDVDDSSSRDKSMSSPIALVACPNWIRHDMKEVKKAMYDCNVRAFEKMREEVLKRADLVMKALQNNVVLLGKAVHGPWVPDDIFESD